MKKLDVHRDSDENQPNGKVKTWAEFFSLGRIFLISCAVLLVFAVLVAVVVFFLSVRGAEEVMVPDVRYKDITSALIELQSKELDARIQLRYSTETRGSIIEQDPKAGTIVKAGRKIRLVLSQGALLSNVGYYVGRKLDDVRREFAAMFGASETPLIAIKQPVLYQFSKEPVGTILEQDPLPGAGISGPTELALIVSRGEELEYIEMPAFIGLDLGKTINAIGRSGIRWVFAIKTASRGETPETVVAQEPPAGAAIPVGGVAHLVVAMPEKPAAGEVAWLFSRTLPENPYPMQTTLDAITPDGVRRTLVNIQHSGGEFTWPYHLPKGSTLVLSLLGREIHRETVQ